MEKKLLSILAVVIPLFAATQNTTSPYSILGIGDIDLRDYSRGASAGHTGVSQRPGFQFNAANPASLTAIPLKTVLFDVSTRGRSTAFRYPGADSFTAVSKDFAVKQIALAFRLNAKTGIAGGLRQYSSISYKYSYEQQILDGNTYYQKTVDGNGGINQVFVSGARTLGHRWSAGVTGSWLFGSIQRNTGYYSASPELDVVRTEDHFLNAAQVTVGAQYASLRKKKWQHQAGFTFTAASRLKGQLTTAYFENGDTVSIAYTNSKSYTLPLTVSAGYTAILRSRLSLSAQFTYSYWQQQKLDYQNAWTGPSFRAGAGITYSFLTNTLNGPAEKSYLAAGITTSAGYVHINNQPLRDHAVNLGGGLHLSRFLSLTGGLEFGIRGNLQLNQLKERYTQFNAGLVLRDTWFGTKKYGRYN